MGFNSAYKGLNLELRSDFCP